MPIDSENPFRALEGLSLEADDPEDGKKANGAISSNFSTESSNLRHPLVWIDLEMTGLDPLKDQILQIACIITDGLLKSQIEGPEIVISHPESVLVLMNDWCIDQHTRSGLSDAVRDSTTSLKQAEDQVIEFIQWHIPESYKPVIAGNSVHVDVSFLKRHMPKLADLFHYRIVDVSSIGELCRRWFPAEFSRQPKKGNSHTAMQDVRESIQQLKFYQQHVFIHPSQQRKKTSNSNKK